MRKLLLIALLSIIALNVSAQKQEVTAKFEVYLDNKKVETDSIFVGFNSIEPQLTKITDSFTTFFKPNSVTSLLITHPRCHKKIVDVDTRGSKDNVLVKVYLETIRDY